MRAIRILFCLSISPFLALTPESILAQQDLIEIDTGLSFHINDVESECYVWVEKNAPYSHFNGDCRLYRKHGEGVNYREDLIAIHRRQNYALGPFPRDKDFSQTWWAIFWTSSPDPESVYCAKLGWDDGSGNLPVIFGHHNNSNENLILPTVSQCRSLPPPTVTFSITFDQCVNGSPRWRLVMSSTGADQFEVQYKVGAHAIPTSWNTRQITSNSITYVTAPSQCLDWRVRGLLSGTPGPWSNTRHTDQGCGSGGGGDPMEPLSVEGPSL